MSSRRPITTAQTIGPFPHEGWRWAFEPFAVQSDGARTVAVAGTVFDGDGEPVVDAVLEAWSPAAAAAESERAMPGFRRVPSDERGAFRFELPAAANAGTPLAYVTLFARGLLKHQFSAVFLEGAAGLADAPLLAQVPAERRATLIAGKSATPGEYRWDVRLQGEGETVFFDYA
jgi:protocatechuate 3,4-dioxygenase, alpha subunit